jgi:hypothetical protein
MNGRQPQIVPLLAFAVLVLATPSLRAQEVINREPEMRATFVDLQRVLWKWPGTAPPPTPFTIGILGKDPFQQGQINYLDRRLAGKRNVRVTRFANVDALVPCHILVVSQAADLKPALKKTRGAAVLVIAQAPGLAEQGAVLNLLVVQNELAMEINMIAANQAGLTPDPRLLRMADEIIR